VANHDNPGDPAVPTYFQINPTLERASAPGVALHAAIGDILSPRYFGDTINPTGPDFCPAAFQLFQFDLGSNAIQDLIDRLPDDWFTVGVVSDVTNNPAFSHIDYIGYPEEVLGIGCPTTSFPGSRISLLVEVNVECAPRNHGYWHRYCLGQGSVAPGRNGGGNGPGPKKEHMALPVGLESEANGAMLAYGMTACEAIDAGSTDKLHAALRELGTAHLNKAAGLLSRGCEVELHPIDDTPGLTVGDAMDMMEARIIVGSSRALKEARWIGEHVVNREALVKP